MPLRECVLPGGVVHHTMGIVDGEKPWCSEEKSMIERLAQAMTMNEGLFDVNAAQFQLS